MSKFDYFAKFDFSIFPYKTTFWVCRNFGKILMTTKFFEKSETSKLPRTSDGGWFESSCDAHDAIDAFARSSRCRLTASLASSLSRGDAAASSRYCWIRVVIDVGMLDDCLIVPTSRELEDRGMPSPLNPFSARGHHQAVCVGLPISTTPLRSFSELFCPERCVFVALPLPPRPPPRPFFPLPKPRPPPFPGLPPPRPPPLPICEFESLYQQSSDLWPNFLHVLHWPSNRTVPLPPLPPLRLPPLPLFPRRCAAEPGGAHTGGLRPHKACTPVGNKAQCCIAGEKHARCRKTICPPATGLHCNLSPCD